MSSTPTPESVEPEEETDSQAILRRLRTIAISVAVTLGVFLLGTGIFVVRSLQQDSKQDTATEKLEAAIDAILAVRVESRGNLCEKDKRFAEGHNLLTQSTVDAIARFITNLGEFSKDDDDTAEELREIDGIVRSEIALVTETLAAAAVDVPLCTPQAIEDFYEGNSTTTTATTIPGGSP